MTTRTSTQTVTFQHPFRLSGIDDEVLPAGHYVIETEEELLEALSIPAYRRLVTSIHLAGRPHSSERSRVLDIDPAELSAALATDGRAQEISPALIKRTTSGGGEQKRGAGEFVSAGWRQWWAFNATEVKLSVLVVGGVALTRLLT
jgi:hypothetical protein